MIAESINILEGRNWRVIVADVLDGLRSLPDESIHCVVTSPPYFNLRDYGVAGQIGLEHTPDEFVAKLVEVFREVRRVLRDDGTCWINLGGSYASGGTRPSQSPLLRRVPAYDIDGTRPQDFPGVDPVCPGSDGEPQGDTESHRAGISHNDRFASQDEPRNGRKDRDNERSDSDREVVGGVLPVSPESTTLEFSSQLSDVFCQEAQVSRFQSAGQPSPLDEHPFGYSSACTPDTTQTLPPLVVRIEGKESFFSACQRLGCKGIGKCGICWCSLAIPSLNIKAKDEINMPHLVAMALQADGWALRQTIIWAKRSPMPESVRDRCTKSHEYIFMLTKRERYFWDQDAVREESQTAGTVGLGFYPHRAAAMGRAASGNEAANPQDGVRPDTRNLRSVWTLGPEPYSEAHFATFPSEIPRRCIKAGTSEKGCCSACGAPWVRITEKTKLRRERPNDYVKPRKHAAVKIGIGSTSMLNSCSNRTAGVAVKTKHWQPSCTCNADIVPCVVLDPFSGSGTTGMVATDLGRKYIGIELSPDYAEMSRKRIESWKYRDVEKQPEPMPGQKELFP